MLQNLGLLYQNSECEKLLQPMKFVLLPGIHRETLTISEVHSKAVGHPKFQTNSWKEWKGLYESVYKT